ncbi:MAG: hypothetical protein J2P37_23165 [Ktedonobacteraceae bacterium]|nr:hypothetical protein [Ktedonobacteraceae bacterium]
MQGHRKKQRITRSRLAFYSKCSAIVILFLFSILMVACAGGANGTANLNDPPVTVTINLGKKGTAAAQPKEYTCGAWATNTSPAINNVQQVGVYAKYVHTVNGNPEGVSGASAVATVHWPDGSTMNVPAKTNVTTGDGLAVFAIPIEAQKTNLVGRLTLVDVTFGKEGTPGCVANADRAAFFTLTMGTPTVTPTPTDPGIFPTITPPTDGTPPIFPTSPTNPKRTPTPGGFPTPPSGG